MPQALRAEEDDEDDQLGPVPGLEDIPDEEQNKSIPAQASELRPSKSAGREIKPEITRKANIPEDANTLIDKYSSEYSLFSSRRQAKKDFLTRCLTAQDQADLYKVICTTHLSDVMKGFFSHRVKDVIDKLSQADPVFGQLIELKLLTEKLEDEQRWYSTHTKRFKLCCLLIAMKKKVKNPGEKWSTIFNGLLLDESRGNVSEEDDQCNKSKLYKISNGNAYKKSVVYAGLWSRVKKLIEKFILLDTSNLKQRCDDSKRAKHS